MRYKPFLNGNIRSAPIYLFQRVLLFSIPREVKATRQWNLVSY